MKILRLFDSLKFLRTIFVAVACAFFIFPAHAELQDTELPVGYKRLTGLKLESASIKITDFYLTGNDTLRFRAKSSAASNWIGSYTTSSADNNYSFYAHMSTTGKYARYNGQTGGSGVSSNTWYSVVMSPNGVSGVRNPSSWTPSNFTCSVPLYIGNMGEGKLVPAPDVSFSGNIVVDGRLTLIPCERESDGVMGYYSLQHNSFFTSNIGTITSLGYDTSHMVEVPIKIATTHYNETKFAPVETDLNAARTTINNLITQMQTNAVNVSKLAVEKQTRPNATCPAGKNCLLVTDPTGAENWYVIAGADAVQSSSNVPDYFSFTVDATDYVTNGQHFQFGLDVGGNFTIDWGDGSEPESITSFPGSTVYHHEYTSAGEYTIRITGRATEYDENESPVISFSEFGDSSTIKAIDGSLGAIFPTLGNGAGRQPNFASLFEGTSITSIPAGLFSGVTGATPYMFFYTFANTQITSIPAGLFDGVTGAVDGMFFGTFYSTQITSIPENLFSGITGSAMYMFEDTFQYTKITSIPENLFRGVTGAADGMFRNTFSNTRITSIPAGLFRGVTGAAESMFQETFSNTQITSIPENLFSGVTSAEYGMFINTFSSCPNLTGYIPESTFAGLIQNNSPDADEFMGYIFNSSTGLATTCPQNTTEVSTPYKSKYWSTGNGNAVMCRPN